MKTNLAHSSSCCSSVVFLVSLSFLLSVVLPGTSPWQAEAFLPRSYQVPFRETCNNNINMYDRRIGPRATLSSTRTHPLQRQLISLQYGDNLQLSMPLLTLSESLSASNEFMESRETEGSSGLRHGSKQQQKLNVAIIANAIAQRFTVLRNCLRLSRRNIRKAFATVLLGFFLTFHTSHMAAWARSGGRAGGSFGRSSSPSAGRVLHRPSRSFQPSGGRTQFYNPSSRMPPRAPPIVIRTGPSLYSYSNTNTLLGQHRAATGVRRTGFSGKDLVILTGTGLLLANGVRKHHQGGGPSSFNFDASDSGGSSSALGPGATVGAITVSLLVPSRTAPGNILSRLDQIVARTDTSRRKGVQDMLSEVSLELLRQESSIISAEMTSQHYKKIGQAEREFQLQSVQRRSKFDRETVNKFGGNDKSDPRESQQVDKSSSFSSTGTTLAVVSLQYAIEGNSSGLPVLRTRSDLLEALSQIGSDAQVENCLMSAEILWVPEDPKEAMTAEDVYADYPNLVPL